MGRCIGYLGPVLATWHIRSEIRHFESDLLVPFCLHEKNGRGRIREHACLSHVGTFLSLRKGVACVSVLISLRHRIALYFHALHDGIVRWMKPRSISLLHGAITDLTKGKSELLVENALLRQQLIILHRHVKRPVCKKTDRFLLLRAARECFGLGSRHS